MLTEKEQRTLDGMYCAEGAHQDELVGGFLEQLRVSGRLDETLVIVTADHGEHLGEKQLIGHGLSLYNELIRVPLLVRDPGGDFPRSSVVASFVSTRRLFHTILAAAGVARPEEQNFTLSHSASGDPEQGLVFAEGIPPLNTLRLLERRAPHVIRERDCDLVRRAVFNGRHKLLKTGETKLELYDVLDDPHEEANLYDVFPEQVERMGAHLEGFVNQTAVAQSETGQAPGYDDPQVRRRLRDLGYLE